MTDKFNAIKCLKFECKTCDFTCSKQSNYTTHLNTRKHKILTGTYEKNANVCPCGKVYKHRQSLFNHQKKCAFQSNIGDTMSDKEDCKDLQNQVSNYPDDNVSEEHVNVNESQEDTINFQEMKHMFVETMQQNRDLRKQLTELIPKVGNTTTNHTTHNTTHNTNNQFNLNFFLNEQCKDAIPLIDFVKSLQYDFDQLEYTGNHGFVEGASKIIMDAMNQLDITKRPIHCTDVKRETFYVKDDESWKKEDERNRSIKTAIHNIRNRNLACVPEWIKAHPNCKKIDDPKNDLFIEIIGQYMDASEKEFNKVIKTIAKSLTIPKGKYGHRQMSIE